MSDLDTASTEDLRQVMNGLLSTLSHDLRTPLSAIAGWLFLLESEKLDATAKKRALDKIRQNVENQVRLIDDIAMLSRSMTGHLQMDVAPISPLPPLAAAIEKLRTTANAGLVSLPPVTLSEVGMVMADSEFLRRVFEILILHALNSTPQNGAVDTAVCIRDGNVEITIADNGRGLNPAELADIFDAFRKGDSTPDSAYPGAERSLMLAKALVDEHGGQLQATSPGRGLGTTFTLRLRCVDAQASSVNTTNNTVAT